MLVYRIEHPITGQGPYSRFDGTYDMQALGELLFESHGLSKEHPGPFEDNLRDFTTRYHAYFACASLELLQEWFKDFWPWLLELGYTIEVYRVKNYKIGKSGKQLAFDVETSKKV